VIPKSPAPAVVTNKPDDRAGTVRSTEIVPLVRKSVRSNNFTQAETDYMMENYKVMAEADEKKGVDAWAKYSKEVGIN
jgi:hypothetical protein